MLLDKKIRLVLKLGWPVPSRGLIESIDSLEDFKQVAGDAFENNCIYYKTNNERIKMNEINGKNYDVVIMGAGQAGLSLTIWQDCLALTLSG